MRTPHLFPTQVRNGDLVYGELRAALVEDLPKCFSNHCRIDVVQLDHGASCCDLDFVAGSQAAICRKRIARPLHLCGTMTGGWIGLGLVHGAAADDATSRSAAEDFLHLASPDVPFDWYLREGQTLLMAMAGQSALQELAGEVHVSEAVRKLIGGGPATAVMHAGASAMAVGRESLLDLLEDARRGELEGNGAAFGKAVLDAMIYLLDAVQDAGTPCGSAEILVRRARKIVGEAPQRFSISALSSELRVSPRTLHKAFVHVTGVGPHAYFLHQRLNAARHHLTDADPRRGSVTNIALELGFTELGRFAGRYREFFGESPSQTLQRPRRRIDPVPA